MSTCATSAKAGFEDYFAASMSIRSSPPICRLISHFAGPRRSLRRAARRNDPFGARNPYKGLARFRKPTREISSDGRR